MAKRKPDLEKIKKILEKRKKMVSSLFLAKSLKINGEIKDMKKKARVAKISKNSEEICK